MTAQLSQGDLGLLQTAAAQRLLASTIPARMAYAGLDGAPRIVPSWFHWAGEEVVMATFLRAPHVPRPARRLAALRANPQVAISIDTDSFPPEVLILRGRAEVTEVDGVVPEYAAAALRYLGPEGGGEYLRMVDAPGTQMARIAVRPAWVGVLDFDQRPPGVMSR